MSKHLREFQACQSDRRGNWQINRASGRATTASSTSHAPFVYTVDLKNILSQINAYCCNLHDVALSSFVVSTT